MVWGLSCFEIDGQFEWHRYDRTMPKLGTLVKVTFFTTGSQNGSEIMDHCFKIIDSLNHILSDYDPYSEVTNLNGLNPGDTVMISAILSDILQKSKIVYEQSGGAFDPAIGQLTKLWRTARIKGKMPSKGIIRKAKKSSGMHLIYFDDQSSKFTKHTKQVVLDFGGIGKGYIGDHVLKYLKSQGIESVLIDLGGDIVVGKAPPSHQKWTLQLEGFSSPVFLENQAIAGSGKTFQHLDFHGTSYSHIINQDSGYGVIHDYKVFVIAGSGWEADSWASAYSVLGYHTELPNSEKYPQMWISSDTTFYSNQFIDYISPSIK